MYVQYCTRTVHAPLPMLACHEFHSFQENILRFGKEQTNNGEFLEGGEGGGDICTYLLGRIRRSKDIRKSKSLDRVGEANEQTKLFFCRT